MRNKWYRETSATTKLRGMMPDVTRMGQDRDTYEAGS